MNKRRANQPIRVLIVEDSWPQRELLVGLVGAADGMVVAGTAKNGQEAIEAAQRLRPDVIAMDIHLPIIDGYTATRRIMQSCPTPIVLISSSTGDSQRRSMQALAAGALAVVRKPASIGRPDHAIDRQTLLTTLRLMADVLVVTRHSSIFAAPAAPAAEALSSHLDAARGAVIDSWRMPGGMPQVLAIASSTGGPAALQTVLQGLGGDFPLPILIAQHIARGFGSALADWLNTVVPLPVRIACFDERMQPGFVYLAPDDHHLLASTRGVIALQPFSQQDRYCPSGDVLFEAVARVYRDRAIGVILTGMGDDGARGMRAMRAAGSWTLAQDEASCVVYGMPQAAVVAGAVAQVEPLASLAGAILRRLGCDTGQATSR
jgi:two-component system chemotaxis response regulator CheB